MHAEVYGGADTVKQLTLSDTQIRNKYTHDMKNQYSYRKYIISAIMMTWIEHQ